MKPIATLWGHFLNDSLFRNSIYLMLTTGVMGVFGFFFWLICTHIFTPEEIGIGTTLISVLTFISFISLLGFNSTFIGLLPKSQNRNDEINTGLILVISTAILTAAVYIFLIPHLTPKLGMIYEKFWYPAVFILMAALISVNSLTDSIFIAYRSAHYNLLSDGFITSGTKLILPIVFASIGAYGVFLASSLATATGMLASIIFLFKKFDFKPKLVIDTGILKKVFQYSFANYTANLINIVPTFVLPIIIINYLSAAAAAYYYLAFMLSNLLYTVSGSISQSLFAEGSHAENTLRILIKRSLVTLTVLLIPASIGLAILGPIVLNFFGKSYGAGGADVIFILAITAPAVAAYNLGTVILRIRHQMYSLNVVSAVYAITISILTLLWVNMGLTWIAIAWAIGNFFAATLAFLLIFLYRKYPTPVTIH
ncbi:MAG: lipopolysaccharide biosynthesis protein [bacterium]|nr:lipopolysaccharide biosynthesis protein [bacterium]